MTRILVTSANGFLGRHLCDLLREQGHDVLPVSGRAYRQRDFVQTLQQADLVIHLLNDAAPDMTTTVLQAMAEGGVGRLVLESSLDVYGEGLYADALGRSRVAARRREDIEAGRWDVMDEAGNRLTPLATPETTPPEPCSAGGLVAMAREEQARLWAAAEDRSLCILRLAPVFGPPAPGGAPPEDEIWRMICAVESGAPPQLAEDGRQVRDWLHVRDAARALQMAVAPCEGVTCAMNISAGSGHRADDVARMVAAAAFRYDLEPKPTGLADLPGAARHLVGAPGQALNCLRFRPELPLENTLGEMVMWLRDHAPTPRRRTRRPAASSSPESQQQA